MRPVQGMKGRVIWILPLICSGIILGSIYSFTVKSQGAMNILELEFENGRLILFPEDRAKLKEQAVNVTLEEGKVKALLVEKNYTIQATLISTHIIQEILQNITLTRSSTRIAFSAGDLVAVVTITFEDGSGYNIRVDLRDWTVGEPEFAENVYPPDPIHRVGPPDLPRRKMP